MAKALPLTDWLEVHPGDLIHRDQHGVITIPLEIAHSVHDVAVERQRAEQHVIDFCRSRDFTVEGLAEAMKRTKY